jgi:hypothetical protein
VGREPDVVGCRHHNVGDHTALQAAHPVREHDLGDATEDLEALGQQRQRRARFLVRGELSNREAALMGWSRQVVHDPNDTTEADVDRLRQAGLSDREIFEATTWHERRLAGRLLGAQPQHPELDKLHAHLLGPMGVADEPRTIEEALDAYRRARSEREGLFGMSVSRLPQQAIEPAITSA